MYLKFLMYAAAGIIIFAALSPQHYIRTADSFTKLMSTWDLNCMHVLVKVMKCVKQPLH